MMGWHGLWVLRRKAPRHLVYLGRPEQHHQAIRLRMALFTGHLMCPFSQKLCGSHAAIKLSDDGFGSLMSAVTWLDLCVVWFAHFGRTNATRSVEMKNSIITAVL